ncbi:hypothetical protein [Alloactinosynnema sp. L-07]|nr:hypothetical protein [Alloactinosynnema sp. L-07]
MAREAIDRALLLIDAATNRLESYRVELTGGPITAVAPRQAERAREDRYADVRARLAPPAPGARTNGKWIDAAGDEHDLVSGNRDEWFAAAAAYARERGWVKGSAVLGQTCRGQVRHASARSSR